MAKSRIVFGLIASVVLVGALVGFWRWKPQVHSRVFGLRAQEVFRDEKVIALCGAIERKDLLAMDELIGQGVDVIEPDLVNGKFRGFDTMGA